MAHAPSQARAIRRDARDPSADLALLLERAKGVEEHAHAAPLLAAFAVDRRLGDDLRAEALDAALSRARKVQRLGQKGEAWRGVLHELDGSRHQVPAAQVAVSDVASMPDGQWLRDAVAAVAGWVGSGGRLTLLRRGLENRGFEAESAKAVLRAADVAKETELRETVEAVGDPELRSRLLASLDHQGADAMGDAVAAAWRIPEPDRRWEALRAVVWGAGDLEDVARVADSTRGQDAEDRSRVLCACAARADRLGDRERAAWWLGDALEAAQQVEAPRRRAKAAAKVADAMAKAELDPGPAKAVAQAAKARPGAEGGGPSSSSPPGPAPASDPQAPAARARATLPDELAPPSGHALALFDGYEGGLGSVHLRAAARGAALCAAFGHELWLLAWPTGEAAALVEAVERETAVGESRRYLERLHEAGRLRLVACGRAGPDHWRGLEPVATTPHPDPDKATGLDGEAVCLLVGLGKRGLPEALLERVGCHHELTGRGVSLETATAMGILADRLGRAGR